jgi:hypothetical protein
MAEFAALAKAKEMYDRAHGRLAKFREENERRIGQTMAVVETVGATAGWAYANGRWGKVEGAHKLPEIELFGIPADLGVGIGLIGLSMFGGLGKYDEHGINVGVGSTGAFAYRMFHELGSKAAAEHPKAAPKTTPQVTSGRGVHGGRVHTYVDEREAA